MPNPDADQPVNEHWAERIGRAVNGGVPLSTGEDSQYPSEYTWLRGQTAKQVLARRNALVSQGDMMTAGADSGLFTLGALDGPQDFQTRGQQSYVAQQFTGAAENKPFTPSETAAFEQVMKSGTIDQKTALLQNVASMGKAAPDAFKQIGEKSPVFEQIGGLNTVSPGVAGDVLRGVQAMQDNPDLKAALSTDTGGPGKGGTTAIFNSIVGNALASVPTLAYGARLAADALYTQRVGPGAAWDVDTYTQAVHDVLGGQGKPVVTTINKQDTLMPPGVNGGDFTTMLHMLTPDDLTAHSVGGSPPHYATGQLATPDDIADEGKFKAISNGVYNIYMGDNQPLGGSGPNGLYAFQVNAKDVDAIVSRPTPLPTLNTAGDGQSGSLFDRIKHNLETPPTVSQSIGEIKDLFPKDFFRIPSREEWRNALQLKMPEK